MNRTFRLRDGTSLNALGLATLAVLVGAAIIVALTIAPIVSMYRHPPTLPSAGRDTPGVVGKFHDNIDYHEKLVDGRSMFFKPLPPEAPGPTTTVHKTYEGPSLVAYIDGTAWFSDGQKLSEKEPKSKTLTLVRAHPPWTLIVQWEGGEYTVDLFKKITISALRDNPSSYSSYGSSSVRSSLPSSGRLPSDRHDGPPEAHSGPGAVPPGTTPAAGDGSSPPPPPPPQTVPGGPAPADPNAPAPEPSPAPQSPTPAPAQSPEPTPQPSPAPSPSEPSKEPGNPPEPSRPSHP